MIWYGICYRYIYFFTPGELKLENWLFPWFPLDQLTQNINQLISLKQYYATETLLIQRIEWFLIFIHVQYFMSSKELLCIQDFHSTSETSLSIRRQDRKQLQILRAIHLWGQTLRNSSNISWNVRTVLNMVYAKKSCMRS